MWIATGGLLGKRSFQVGDCFFVERAHVIARFEGWRHESPDPVIAGQSSEQLVGSKCTTFVLLLALTDELRDVFMLGGVGIVEVAVVNLRAFESVVLDADQVIDDVVGDRVLACHKDPFQHGSTEPKNQMGSGLGRLSNRVTATKICFGGETERCR